MKKLTFLNTHCWSTLDWISLSDKPLKRRIQINTLKQTYEFVIIGSGVAGLSAANTLTKNKRDVLIIDKGNNPGGRLSTRNHPLFSFDHGAQFFTTKDSEFNELVQTGAKNK